MKVDLSDGWYVEINDGMNWTLYSPPGLSRNGKQGKTPRVRGYHANLAFAAKAALNKKIGDMGLHLTAKAAGDLVFAEATKITDALKSQFGADYWKQGAPKAAKRIKALETVGNTN